MRRTDIPTSCSTIQTCPRVCNWPTRMVTYRQVLEQVQALIRPSPAEVVVGDFDRTEAEVMVWYKLEDFDEWFRACFNKTTRKLSTMPCSSYPAPHVTETIHHTGTPPRHLSHWFKNTGNIDSKRPLGGDADDGGRKRRTRKRKTASRSKSRSRSVRRQSRRRRG
jgi:hypothetical protein